MMNPKGFIYYVDAFNSPMKNSIPKILRMGFILGLFVLVISAAIPYYNFTMMRDSERWVAHTMQVLQAADSLRIAVVDAETGQRGYLLTQDPLYLQPFVDSQKKIGEQLNLLRELTDDNSAQQKYMTEIDAATQQKLKLMQTTIQLEEQGKHDEAMQIVHTNEGRRLMVEIRRLLGEFQQAEKQLLASRTNEANTDATHTLYSFLIISCINFLLFALLYYLILKNAQRRHLAEAALNHQTNLLGSVINNMSEGLYVVDTAGKPLLHNPVMQEIYDHQVAVIKLDEWASTYELANIDGSSLDFKQFPAFKVLAGEAEASAEMIVRLADTEQAKIVRVSARPLINSAGVMNGAVCIFSDISELKKTELKLRLAMQQAESSSKAKSEFVANMSHEIRTPLNAIMGTAQLLNKTVASATQHKYINMIVLSAQSLLTILNDILDFSKIEAGKIELVATPFYLRNVMHQLAAIMSMAAEKKNIELIINVDPAIPPVLVGDSHRLNQILINFISNAIKFTEKGEVTVSVSGETKQDKVMMRFAVADTGIGISPAQQARLFSPFIQADSSITRKFGGTGLGLTISRRLVELMGGSIGVTSVLGKGSEFSAIIPFAIGSDTEASAPHYIAGKQLHLLVIDENESVRASIAAIIAQWQWSAELVASAAEAVPVLQQANANNRHYDAILLDRKIRARADQQSINAIRTASAKNIPVILMTNMYGQDDIAGTEIEKPDGVLFKPVTSSTLYDSLNELSSPVKNQAGVNQAAATNNANAAAANNAANGTNAHKILKGVRALLVEDNEFNQIVARDLLEQVGALVDIVGDGEKAVNTLRNCAHLYDIILMDVQMPVMDGFTATKKLRQELNITLPIIAMTAGVTEFERTACIQSGMDDLIAKPIEVDKMIAVIARYTSAAQYAEVAQNNNVQVINTDGVFDINKLLKIGSDNPDYVQKTIGMVRNLVTNTEANFAAAKNAFALGDYEAVAGVLHSLRGSLGILGAKRLVENALVLEQLISEQAELAALENALQAVETELSITLAAATRWLQGSANAGS